MHSAKWICLPSCTVHLMIFLQMLHLLELELACNIKNINKLKIHLRVPSVASVFQFKSKNVKYV